jgi:type I restriction enzyme S subunit
MGIEWPELTIDELKAPNKGSIAMGPFGSRIKAENFVSSGVPVIKGAQLHGAFVKDADFDYLTEEKAQELSSSIAVRGDLVITHRGTIGQVSIIPDDSKYEKYIVSQSQLKVTLDSKKINPYFANYFFRSRLGQHRLLANASQVGVPAIAKASSSVKEILVPCPDLRTQQNVVEILKSLDDKIELNRQMNETLEAMAQALFKSWFVDFDPVIDNALAAGNEIPEPLQARAEKRQALGDQRKPLPAEIQSLFPDRFVFTDEMGWVPEGWEVKLVGDILELAYGKSLPATKRIDGKFPVYGSGGVSGYHNECLVKGPGVVVGRKGTVGSLYWAEQDFFPIDTVFYVVNKSSAPLYWLYQTLALHDIKSMGADSAVPGVNRNTVYNKTMVIPSSEILDEYLASLGPINARRSELTPQSKTLADLRDALLPKLLSGELRIPDAEKQVAEAV